jgi:NTP pyrophosphatase (non-canonical NTP hydrolase)
VALGKDRTARSSIWFEPEALLAATRLIHMKLEAFQDTMRQIYLARDEQRGVDGTFRWLTEELGELARAIRTSERTNLELEFSDVLAWLTSLANLLGVDLADAASRYNDGCPKCGGTPCVCPR